MQVVLGDLVAGREPDSGLVRDVLERLVEVLVSKRLADDERMQGQGHDPAAVGRVGVQLVQLVLDQSGKSGPLRPLLMNRSMSFSSTE